MNKRLNKRLNTLLLCLALSACASAPENAQTRSPADPWEPFNRSMYAVNDGLDRALLRPIAKGYEFVLPQFMRTGVSNFFDNLDTPLTAINNALQGKGAAAGSDLGRLLLNSTIGIGGLFDVATKAGLEKHNEDFGQTMAVWGVPSGPYLVLPIFGPSTVRDGAMTPFNRAAGPVIYAESSVRDKLLPLSIVDARHRLFAAEALIKDSADRYVTFRESYLQRRNYLVYDGDPPADDDFYDDFEEDFEDDIEE